MIVPTELEKQIDGIITHYPPQHKRAAVLWLLHLLQEHFGCLGKEQVEWTAAKLGLQPINVFELVSFYPMFTSEPRGKFQIKVCRTLSCELGGCSRILDHLQKKLGVGLEETTADGLFTISTVECLASCGTGPVMMVNDELFESLTPEQVDAIIDRIKTTGRLDPQRLPALQPAHPMEKRVLLANASRPGYTGSIADCEGVGGYQVFRKALGMKPEDIVNEVKESKLRGRGGAGFPTGLKWQFLDRKSGKPIYLICNADESEPGTFKDRQFIYYDPHQLLEGMLISCYAVGAHTAYIYIRGEMALGAKILLHAIEEARARNYLGRNILGKGFDCEIYVHRGAGAYICGEETGLIESLEGKRSYPRIKPPFPAVVGLFGCPTVVNNVETLSNIPHIVKNGAAWYKAMGVPGSSGTRLVCVSGPVKRPGYYEFEMGKLTMRQLIYDLCGGLKDGRTLKGVVPGGSSMPVLKADQIDVPLDFDSLQKAGTAAGSGGVIVLDETTNIVNTTFNISKFYAHESCGQCTPCREGTLWMEKMLHRIKEGGGRPKDVDLLYDVADNIDGKTICPLGEAAAWPVKAFVTKYRDEFEAACIRNGKEATNPHE
jgi:NADH-quinone oxidoreductase subunit F